MNKANIRVGTLVQVKVADEYAEAGSRRFIAEANGYPKDGKVPIRVIPGNPQLLDEVALEDVSVITGRYYYVHYAELAGRGQFPVDMLRYDSCVPVNFSIIKGECGPIVQKNDNAPLLVARVSTRRDPDWTYARWSSFLWGCKHFATHTR